MKNDASTYRILTAQRILQNYGVELSQVDIQQAVNDSDSVYYAPLHCTFDIMYDRLILEQARTYLSVAQQAMVDILLMSQTKMNPSNGAADDQGANSPMNNANEQLEDLQNTLEQLNKAYQNEDFFLLELVAESQVNIRSLFKEGESSLAQSRDYLEPFLNRAADTKNQILELCEQIRGWIVQLNQLIPLLPDYRQDEAKKESMRETLAMMTAIGYNRTPERY